MNITYEGKTLFNDVYELIYYLLIELDLEVQSNGTIYNPEKNEIFSFNGKIIKASVNPNFIHYAGEEEIDFDILNNIRLITVLFGKFIEKKCYNENESEPDEEKIKFVSWFNEEQEFDGIKYSRLGVKHDTYNTTYSNWYCNKCLKFIDMIFRLNGEEVELRNFDSTFKDDN